MATTIPVVKTDDDLNARTGLPTLSTISTPNVTVSLATGTSALSAWITNISVSEVRSGSPGYQQLGTVFTVVDTNTYPCLIAATPTGVISTKCTGLAVSATGAECALGAQTLTYTLTLSNVGLSGAAYAALTGVSTSDSTLTTVVSTTNTAYNSFTCQSDFNRLWNLQG